VHDLSIIVVSTNEAHWLGRALSTVFEHAGDISLDVVVADNSSTDGTGELVEREFPEARVVLCENHGFAHANNRAWMTTDARYALFLNPDTEIVEGSFAALVAAMDERPQVGLCGVRQLTGDGELFPTIRRFPNAARALGEALGSERWPVCPGWAGERELDLSLYEREVEIDWTSGSFMLARREALLSVGILDERSFLYGEEPDLCLRMRRAGWEIRHFPWMTIIHHAGKTGVNPRMEAQNAFARRHHALVHLGRTHRVAFLGAHSLRYGLRAIVPGGGEDGRRRRQASHWAFKVLWGVSPSPFGPPPRQAVPVAATAETAYRQRVET
jgi:GT2 family glycosyltransferase